MDAWNQLRTSRCRENIVAKAPDRSKERLFHAVVPLLRTSHNGPLMEHASREISKLAIYWYVVGKPVSLHLITFHDQIRQNLFTVNSR